MPLSRQQLIQILADLEPRLRAEGITRLAVFGSRARGDNRPDSDVDVVIDIASGAPFSLLDLVGVAQGIEDQTGLPANIFMRRSLDESFAHALERDAIEVFG